MSFRSIQEDYLDPDKHLWPEDIQPPRCRCGAFLKFDPDGHIHWRETTMEEQLDGPDIKVINDGTVLIRICTRCKHENSEAA